MYIVVLAGRRDESKMHGECRAENRFESNAIVKEKCLPAKEEGECRTIYDTLANAVGCYSGASIFHVILPLLTEP